jgi:hypothetical protein
MSLSYSFLSYDSPVPIPPRQPNGGLYTGKVATGPWGNYPVIPDATIYTINLQSAEPPPDYKYQVVSTLRPGNNPTAFPDHTLCDPNGFNNLCANK